MSRALVLFSGGLDSTTTLALARSRGMDLTALIFQYGQRHGVEVIHAKSLAELMGVRFVVQSVDLAAMGGSALTEPERAVPKGRVIDEMLCGPIPPTYVPARNTIFLAFALGWAEVLETDVILLGVNAVDYSGYPDCRPEYIEAFSRLANLALRRTTEGKRSLEIQTPLLELSKAEIIRLGTSLGVDYSRTWSCYAPEPDPESEPDSVPYLACGLCDSCRLRRKGFREAGIADPTRYVSAEL